MWSDLTCTARRIVAESNAISVKPDLSGRVETAEEQQRNGAEYNFRHVDQPPPQREGMSAFALKDGVVHHTYSTYDRGVEQLMGTLRILEPGTAGS
jgi:predicted dithiol-disulfide oxidoreductase (DUF899 family)